MPRDLDQVNAEAGRRDAHNGACVSASAQLVYAGFLAQILRSSRSLVTLRRPPESPEGGSVSDRNTPAGT